MALDLLGRSLFKLLIAKLYLLDLLVARKLLIDLRNGLLDVRLYLFLAHALRILRVIGIPISNSSSI